MHYEKYYGLTVCEMLEKAEQTYGKKNLFTFQSNGEIVHIDYAKFLQDVRTVATKMNERNWKGKYVAFEGKGEYEIIVSYYAAISVGAIAVMLNLDVSESEIKRAIKTMNSVAVICSEDGYDNIEDIVKAEGLECIISNPIQEKQNISEWIALGEGTYSFENNLSPDDPALVLLTSGSTSLSKYVLLSHYAFLPRKEFFTEKNILLFPLYHIAGIALVSTCIVYGIELCLSNMKQGIRDIEWFRPTEMVAVPAFISVLVNRSKQGLFDIKTFKGITSGAAPQNLETSKYLEEQGIFTYSSYGATETSGPVGYITTSVNRRGSVGKPGPWNEIKLADNGEILIKGKNIMLGYIGNPEETQAVLEDGWYHTGDVGRFDEDGYLYITGRIKNVIILSNGENVSPEAIESQLNPCTEIEEVVVRGEDDMIVAHIWCGENDSEEVRERVEKFIKQYNKGVPSYHRIQRTIFRNEAFEKTSTGKIKR